MSQTNLEMEDAENPHGSEQSPRDSESTLIESSNGEGGMSSCATGVTSNGSDDEDEEKNGGRSPVKDQVELDIKLEGTEHRQVVAMSNSENLIDMNIKDNEDTVQIKTMENEIDTKDEVSKSNVIEGEMNEEKLAVDVAEKAECEQKDDQNRLDQVLEHSTLGVELSAPQRENGDQTDTVQVKGEEVYVDVDSHSNEVVADAEGERHTQAECKLNDDGNMFGQNVEKVSDFVTPTEEEMKSEKACDFAKPTGEEVKTENNSDGGFTENSHLGVDLSSLRNDNCAEAGPTDLKGEEMDMNVDSEIKKEVEDGKGEEDTKAIFQIRESDDNAQPVETTADGINDFLIAKQFEDSSPNLPTRLPACNAGHQSAETLKCVFTPPSVPPMGKVDDETPEDQAAFLKELEVFHHERGMDFKQPKFYGQPLNCLKLWRLVIRMGGYDKVTASKFWKLVGESFHPPKTCTTVSWTFRIFYEKSLLEFERYKTEIGELQLPAAVVPEASFATEGTFQASEGGSGSGRARRDSAARAIQGWQPLTNGEAAEHVAKDKNLNNEGKREKNIKTSGSLKQKRPRVVEHPNKAALPETPNQVASSIISIGSPAEWVKINVRKMHDCFEVYALVPGLLREEVRVQADPAGRVVITGQPEQVDNPWGITPFKKVVSLPERIDPLATSAVVSMHGRLFVRVPFEKPA